VQIEPEFGVTDTSKSLAYGPGLTGGKVSRNAQVRSSQRSTNT